MKVFLVYVLTVILISISGCEKPSGPGNCPNNISVMVHMSERPIFSWNPPCDIDGITVYLYVISPTGFQTLSPVWSLWTEENQTPISSPITYGVNIEGVRVVVNALQLMEGDEYIVKVFRNIDVMPGYDIIGETNFIYMP